VPHSRIVVIDNRGDYVAPSSDNRLSVHRPRLRCLVTDAAYVHHLRRGTMQLIPEETSEHHRQCRVLVPLTGDD
jgi:hypothetical protein